MYSKNIKYRPIKGIIKVYDINSDDKGSSLISVGVSNLVNDKTSTIIERDITHQKVKMKIEIKNLGIV